MLRRRSAALLLGAGALTTVAFIVSFRSWTEGQSFRDTAPKSSGQLTTSRIIPNILHRTWRDSKLPDWATQSTHTWRTLNPEMEMVLHTDQDTEQLVRSKFPRLLPAFQQMIPIEKADLLRYLVIYEFGGYYADLDVSCALPVREWLATDLHASNVDMWLGVEKATLRPDWHVYYARQFQLVQWTLAAVPKHPILGLLIDMIVEYFEQGRPSGRKAVVNSTGPGIFTDAALHWLESEYNVTILNQITQVAAHGFHAGGVRILPQVAFASGSGGEDPPGTQFVRHHFQGSWKTPINDDDGGGDTSVSADEDSDDTIVDSVM